MACWSDFMSQHCPAAVRITDSSRLSPLIRLCIASVASAACTEPPGEPVGLLGWKRNYVGQHFWVRWYFASTIGRILQVIRDYIRHHEAEDRRIDQLQTR